MTAASGPGRRPVRPFGDRALVAECASLAEAHGLAAVVGDEAPWPGIEEVVVGHRSLTVIAAAHVADLDAVEEELATLRAAPLRPDTGRTVEVPVAFDGPDLAAVAELAGVAPGEVVTLLAEARLQVSFLGFLPGFAYLEGLPDVLARVPRRPTPRPVVAGGSVALGGGFAGVYPQASPGGWQVVGRSGFPLFDPDAPPFATLRPGDVVRWRPTHDPGEVSIRGRGPLRPAAEVGGRIVVEDPGLLTTVQDLGRRGVAGVGVPPAGAADPYALRAANRLVGNGDDAAALELTGHGPRLRFTAPAHVAVLGRVGATLDGLPVPADAVVPVAAGQLLAVGSVAGHLRAYLAVAGGIDVAPTLGSRSSDVLTGLGPGPLGAGDALGVGAPARPRGWMDRSGGGPLGLHDHGAVRRVRVVPGPDHFEPGALDRLATTTWHVATASDRVGVRLTGDTTVPAPVSGVASRAVVTGAIQIPPDGQPVALLCDHATVGGYPVAATVASADVGILAGCRPGDRVQLEIVDTAEARGAGRAAERSLAGAVGGWYPVRGA